MCIMTMRAGSHGTLSLSVLGTTTTLCGVAHKPSTTPDEGPVSILSNRCGKKGVPQGYTDRNESCLNLNMCSSSSAQGYVRVDSSIE